MKLLRFVVMNKLPLAIAASVFLLGGMTTASAWEEITATEAYNMLEANSNAYILDVRTPGEWYWVGHPGKTTGTSSGEFLEGRVFNIPFWFWDYMPNTGEYAFSDNRFFDAAVVRQFRAYDILILMCRTGGRAGLAGTELEDPTQPAAKRLEELGFYELYNMKGGFEGKNGEGWLPSGLPYNKSLDGIWKPSDQQGRSLK